MGEILIRNPAATCLGSARSVAFLCNGRSIVFAREDERNVALDVWNVAARPVVYDDIAALNNGNMRDIARSIVRKMIDVRVLVKSSEKAIRRLFDPRDTRSRTCQRLLVCMSGSIQSADFFAHLGVLRHEFSVETRIVLTRSAQRFVRPRAIRNLLDCEVFTGKERESQHARVLHIELSKWASLVLLAPATAATISRIAHAASCDLVSQVMAALPSVTPVVIGPSMNSNMWTNEGVQQNIRMCRDRGYWIIEPGFGRAVSDGVAGTHLNVGGFGCPPAQLSGLLSLAIDTCSGPGCREKSH